MANEMYNVVFQYTNEAAGYEGVITWSSFKDEAQFKDWYTPDIEKLERVMAQGVTSDEAIKLVEQTPLGCYIAASLQDAINPDTGEVNNEILEMKLATVAFAMSKRK